MTDIQIADSARVQDSPVAASPKQTARKTAAPQAASIVERLLGMTAIVTLTWCCIALEGGHAHNLLQVVPIAMIVAITLGGLILSHGARPIAQLLAVCFGASVATAEQADELRSVCRHGRRLAYAGGTLQIIAGLVQVLSVLDQPSLIGPGLAVCFAGFFWAPAIAELGFGSAEHWVGQRSQS